MKPILNQRGATLLISLIMLVVLTLFAISAINLTNVNLRIAGNMQIQSESQALAQQAIEQVLSSDFTKNPTYTALTNQGDFVVTRAKSCTESVGLKNTELNMSDPLDRPCMGSGTSTNTGIIYEDPSGATKSVVNTPWCSKQQWDVSAQVTDSRTASRMALHQGSGLRVEAGTACP